MTTRQKILSAAVFAVVGGIGVFEAHQNSRLREENELLRQQRAPLAEQVQQLQRERDEATERRVLLAGDMPSNSVAPLAGEQFRELLRLRGEVGVLRKQLADALNQAPKARVKRELWELELPKATDGQARGAAPENLAPGMVDADPAAAFKFSERLSAADRRKFLDSAFATWAQKDTGAALQWVEQQLTDPVEKDAAMKAIRSVAPVGIGAELAQKDGYAVINRLLPGSAAELNGQLHPGDRIVAVAQGDNVFVDARTLRLQDLVQSIRGAPGTPIQLQVLPADAPLDSLPKTVTLSRDQIKLSGGK